MRTPENKFIVEFLVDGAEYMAVKGILDDLYAENAFMATRLLSAMRSELDSELSETALRWRSARLADLGFPTLEEALSWFARPPRTEHPSHAGLPARPPGFFVAARPGVGLFDRAAARLSDDERRLAGAGSSSQPPTRWSSPTRSIRATSTPSPAR